MDLAEPFLLILDEDSPPFWFSLNQKGESLPMPKMRKFTGGLMARAMRKISLACIWIPSLCRSRLIHRSLTLFICQLVVHDVTAARAGNRRLQYVTNRNVATTTNTSPAPQAWPLDLTRESHE